MLYSSTLTLSNEFLFEIKCENKAIDLDLGRTIVGLLSIIFSSNLESANFD